MGQGESSHNMFVGRVVGRPHGWQPGKPACRQACKLATRAGDLTPCQKPLARLAKYRMLRAEGNNRAQAERGCWYQPAFFGQSRKGRLSKNRGHLCEQSGDDPNARPRKLHVAGGTQREQLNPTTERRGVNGETRTCDSLPMQSLAKSFQSHATPA